MTISDSKRPETLDLAALGNERRAPPGSAQEKENRTAEQKKIDSQLLYAIYQMRGEATSKGTPTDPIQLERDGKGRVLIDIRTVVTAKVISRIQRLGGKTVSTSKESHSIIAYLSLEKLEALARSKDVVFIAPRAQAMTN